MPRTSKQVALAAHRKANSLCDGCGSDLKPLIAWPHANCPECRERIRVAAARYNASPSGRARARRYMGKVYVARRAAGECVDCAAPSPDKVRCEDCMTRHKIWNAEHLDRREAARAG